MRWLRHWQLTLSCARLDEEPQTSLKACLLALVGLNRRPAAAQFKSISGAFLLMLALALIHKQRAFPGWWAGLPVLATTMLISAGPDAWFNRVVLAQRGLVRIGLISYPLYLWHWLLLAFTRAALGGQASSLQCAIAVLASFVLSGLTYKLVEQPLRFGNALRIKTLGLLLALGLLGGAGHYLAGQPMPAYSPYQQLTAHYLSSMVRSTREHECFDLPYAYRRTDSWYCILGSGSGVPAVFAYGDSHAFSMLPTFEAYASQYKQRVAFLANSGCPPLFGVQSWSDVRWMEEHDCRKTNERIFRYVEENRIKSVILIARWNYYVGGLTRPDELNFISAQPEKDHSREISRRFFVAALQQTIDQYNAIGTRVYWVADNPQQKYAARDALKKAATPTDLEINRYAVSRNQHVADQAFVTQLLAG